MRPERERFSIVLIVTLLEHRFWTDHSAYILELQSVQTQDAAFKARIEHAQRELEKLQKTNVYCLFHSIAHMPC